MSLNRYKLHTVLRVLAKALSSLVGLEWCSRQNNMRTGTIWQDSFEYKHIDERTHLFV